MTDQPVQRILVCLPVEGYLPHVPSVIITADCGHRVYVSTRAAVVSDMRTECMACAAQDPNFHEEEAQPAPWVADDIMAMPNLKN